MSVKHGNMFQRIRGVFVIDCDQKQIVLGPSESTLLILSRVQHLNQLSLNYPKYKNKYTALIAEVVLYDWKQDELYQ